MKPVLSIIVPVYNAQDTLERCIDSILAQTYKNFELLLINDGSTDNSLRICENYAAQDERVRIIDQQNGGLSYVRNVGIKEAKGEYVAWCDSDDFVSDNYLADLYHLIEHYQVDIAICTKQVVNMDLKNLADPYVGKDFEISTVDFFEKMLYGELPGIGVGENGRLYKKELLEGIEYPVGKLFEDSSTSYQIVMKTDRVGISLKPMYYYIRNINSIVQRTFTMKRMEFVDAEEKMTSAVAEKYPEVKDAARRRLMYAYMNTLAHAVLSNNKEFAEIEHDLKRKILANYDFLVKNPRIPKKDALAVRILKWGGLPTYKLAFQLFKKKQMS